MVKSIFPEHQWQDWRFSVVPRNFWTNPTNQRKLLVALCKHTFKSDWESFDDNTDSKLTASMIEQLYQLKTEHLTNFGGAPSPGLADLCCSQLTSCFQRQVC